MQPIIQLNNPWNKVQPAGRCLHTVKPHSTATMGLQCLGDKLVRSLTVCDTWHAINASRWHDLFTADYNEFLHIAVNWRLRARAAAWSLGCHP